MASINTIARAGMNGPYSRPGRSANDFSALKKLPILFASLLAAVCQAMPLLFDRAASLRAVGIGMVSDAASWGDRLSVAAFSLGGLGLVDTLRFVTGILSWFVGFLILFLGASLLRGRLRTPAFILAGIACLAASAWGIGKTLSSAARQIKTPELLAPLALVEAAKSQGGRLFINASTLPLVAPFAKNLIDPALSLRQISELGLFPEKWRTEDRSKPFAAVLLGGSLSDASPLLAHLMDSPDWFIARIDNQGLLFLRGEKPDQAASQIPDFASPHDRALYLAQYALNLDAAGFKTLAATTMEEAMNLAEKDYEVLFRAASLASSQSRWERARKLATAATQARPGAYEGEYLLALALLETRAVDKSFDLTSALLRKYPDDSNVLLLHARAARALHDYSAETTTLEHLLHLAEKNHASTARIHIHLAQAWAQRGFPDQSLQNYRAALAEGLTALEEKDVREAISTIEKNRLPTQPR